MNKLFFLSLIMLGLVACTKKTLNEGKASLEGTWLVTQVATWKGEFTENGHGGLTEKIETGDLGVFVFEESNVELSYLVDSTFIAGDFEWALTLEKVNEGFVKTNNWVLDLGPSLSYALTFENDTKNSERDAHEITLFMEPQEIGPGMIVELILEKQ